MRQTIFKILCLFVFWLNAITIDLKASTLYYKLDTTPTLIVYVFLSETCPMSQSYVPVLNKIQEIYQSKHIEVVGIFPNFYVTDSTVNQFTTAFGVKFKVERDAGFIFTNKFDAHLTPEVFLVDNMTQNVLYTGAIDNAYFRAGKRRGKTCANYLADAIDKVLINKKIEVTKTQAFGCVIVKD